MTSGSLVEVGGARFHLPVDGGRASAFAGRWPDAPTPTPDAAFARALRALDDGVAWTLAPDHGPALAHLEDAFARVPVFAPAGKSPLAPAAALRLAELVVERLGPGPHDLALWGDLELAALALHERGHRVTLIVDAPDAWSALAAERGVTVVPARVADPVAPALQESFALAIVDANVDTEGYVALLARALTLVAAGREVAAITHPRLRDKALPTLVAALPVEDDPDVLVDALPRVVPGPAFAGEHWDVCFLTRDDDALPVAPDARCDEETARDLDPDLFLMLAEELHGFTVAPQADDVERAAALVTPLLGLTLPSAHDDGALVRRRFARPGGAFLDVDVDRARAFVSVCLGGYLPRRFQALAAALLVTLPARAREVRFP